MYILQFDTVESKWVHLVKVFEGFLSYLYEEYFYYY